MECKNCRHPLSGEDNFCNACGAKVIDHRLTLKYLLSEFYERFITFENNIFLKTFLSLYTKPQDVILGYITGLRKRYINVASYIALAITLTGFQFFLIQEFFPESMQFNDFQGSSKEFMDSWMNYFKEYQSFFYILLIPVYALISKLTFLKKKEYNYTEHIVLIGYTQAQLSITFFIPVIFFAALGFNIMSYYFIMTLIMILYTAYCIKNVFELNMIQIVKKTLVFLLLGSVLYFIIIILFVIIIIVYTSLTGSNNPFAPQTSEALTYAALHPVFNSLLQYS